MAAFQVTASELKKKAGELRDLNSRFESQVSSLESQEISLGTMWEGEAKKAFHVAFTNDKTQMSNFKLLIDQYCSALENIASQYELAEAKNVSTATARNY